MTPDESKRAAAVAALAELPEEGIIGLGTGSTARLFIEEVGALVKAGWRFRAVPTSDASRVQAEGLGIEVLPEAGPWDIAVTIDGADEVDPRLDLIKGGRGAHLRENRQLRVTQDVIIVDESKLSPSLGVRWSVPVEVVVFGQEATAARLAAFGKPVLRLRGGAPFRTESGNVIYDVACGPLADAPALDHALHAIPGVVETGLFIGRADVVIVAGANGIERRTPPR